MKTCTLLRRASIFLLIFSFVYSLNAELSLNQALSLSQETGKNIYIEYTADWCLPCQVFQESVLSNEMVIDIIGSDFIMIKANYDNLDHKDIFAEYDVACMPTQHIINSDGEVLLELSGSMSSTEFYNAILPFALNIVLEEQVSDIDPQLKTNTKFQSDKIGTSLKTKPVYKSIVSTKNEIAKNNKELTKNYTSSKIDNVKIAYDDKNQKKSQNYSDDKIIFDYYYALQVGAFSNFDNALKQKEKILATVDENVYIVYSRDGDLYTVQLGRFQSKQDLKSLRNILKQTGIDHFVKRNRV